MDKTNKKWKKNLTVSKSKEIWESDCKQQKKQQKFY